MNLAYQYALEFTRPTLWVIFGMIASGKSTVSDRLVEKLDIRLLRSDVIRFKEGFDVLDVSEDTYISADTDRPLEETMTEILASDYFLLAEQTASVIENMSKT